MRIQPEMWRAGGPDQPGQLVPIHRRQRLARHVVSRNARRRQRRPDRERRRRDRLRLGLPRGHLRNMRVHGRRHSARAGSAARPCASCTCGGSRTATRSLSSRGGRRHFRWSRTSSSIEAPSIGSSRRAATARSTAAARRTRNAILIPKTMADKAMDSAACIACGACVASCKNASAALFTSAKVSPPGAAAPGTGRALSSRRSHGRAARRGRVRQLFERRRMRSGVSEGNSDLQHRANEPRVFQGDAGQPRVAVVNVTEPPGRFTRSLYMSNRRTFLKSVAAVAVAGGAAIRATAAEQAPAAPAATGPITKSVLISMLPKALPYAERFAMARTAGFAAVEMQTVTAAEEAAEIREAATKAGLRIHSVMNSDHWRLPLSSSDPDVVDRSVQGMETSLKNAALWGADAVLLVPAVVDAKTSYKDAWTRSQRVIRERLLPVAKDLKVVDCGRRGVEQVPAESARVRTLCRRVRVAAAARPTSTSATSCSTASRRTGSGRSVRGSPRCI